MNLTPKEQADALIAQGRALLEQGDLARATDLLNQAVRLYWAAGEQYAAAAQIGNYGWALRRKGRPDLARPYLEQAAALFEQLGLKDFAERHRFAAEDVNPGVTEELLASLPPAVRGALERGDGAGLQFALDALPLAERNLVLERLAAAGVIAPWMAKTPTVVRRRCGSSSRCCRALPRWPAATPANGPRWNWRCATSSAKAGASAGPPNGSGPANGAWTGSARTWTTWIAPWWSASWPSSMKTRRRRHILLSDRGVC